MTISKLGRRVTAVVALTALTTLSACSGATPDENGPESPAGSVTISLLPPIAQQGEEPADPEQAQAVVSARFAEDSAGRTATLEGKTDGAWEESGTAEVRANGSVDFPVDGAASAYRVVAEAEGDLPAESSPEVQARAAEPDFSDEFDGEALSTSWYARGLEYNPDGLRACSKGDPSAVEVAGGELRLKVIDDPARSEPCVAKKANGDVLGSYSYRLNGHVATAPDIPFQYGVTAARIKFQREPGQHGSFWLQSFLSEMTSAAESGAEIDVVEYFGDDKNDRLASFVHYPTEDGYEKEGDWIEGASDFLAGKDDDWWKAYHVFSLEWTEDEYVIRIDGEEAWRTDQGVSQQPEFIVLSLLSSDYELGNLPSDDLLPQTMAVDWVRHWAPAEG